MSVLVYNGITLPYGYTTHFEQKAIYDDAAHTDRILTEFTIGVQCVLNLNYLGMIAPKYRGAIPPAGTAPDNAAAIMKAIRVDLMKPRKQLSFTFNGIELLPLSAGNNDGTVDAANGPQPQSCVIFQLTDVTFLCQYRIIANYWENNETDPTTLVTTNKQGGPVLVNRWSETVDIDNCMLTTRARSGRFRIRSDNKDGWTADQLRSQFAVVGVPQGFLRVSSRYTISPDGLTIQYDVTDREVFRMPPTFNLATPGSGGITAAQAFEADGEYTESGVKAGAIIRYGEVRLRLRGCKDKTISSQDGLMKAALYIASKKLNTRGPTRLEGVYITCGMYENWVEVRMRARMNTTKERLENTETGSDKGFDSRANGSKGITWVPLSEDADISSPPYKDRGTASYLLQAAAYFDPNVLNTSLQPGDIGTTQNPFTTGGTPTSRYGAPNSQDVPGMQVGKAGAQLEP